MIYFLSIVAVILCILLVVFAVTGLLSFSEQYLCQVLSITLDNAVSKVTEQFDRFTAQGIKLSSQISTELEYLMEKNNQSFQDFNDNPALIEELQQALYNPLNTTLELSAGSGAYIILDITTNTSVPNAASSRSGLYLRRTSVNDCNPVSSETALFRGVKEVARKNRLELHNRRNMEFDAEKFPFYRQFRENSPARAADSYLWTRREALTGTWEDAMYLLVPIIGSRGEFYGLCGIEISSLYFRLSYPSTESQFGDLVTVLAPYEQDCLCLSEGICGAERRGKFIESSLPVKPLKRFNSYASEKKEFIGMHREVTISTSALDQTQWTVAVLSSAAYYRKYTLKRKITTVTTFLCLLLVLIAVSVFLSRRYVRPITQRLQAIQDGNFTHDTATGLSELDELMQFLQTQQQVPAAKGGELPEGIQEIFDNFVERTKKLTDAEHNILGYYIQGYQIMQIPDIAYISMSTVRKHNRSIYEKLNVASRDELMLYIDLLRRCGRLDDILTNQDF